jgi:O-acetyl-ADP-ribose deacetylase (regulator of RNase III)
MITFKTGNILDAGTQALVNTVNTVGVMGKGIALQFKNSFPENYAAYKAAVDKGLLKIGEVQVVPVRHTNGVAFIINFPTKAHWRFPSRIEWIEQGLKDLKEKIATHNIRSIAIPPLGCGQGGLNWNQVKPIIIKTLEDVDAEIILFEPNELIKEALKKEENSKAKKLTGPRAMLLYLLYQYRALGEFTSEFAAEKLSYFLQRFGEKQLKLQFEKGHYGPYSGKVRHLLYAMNGYYLKGYEQKDAKPFEPLEIVVEKASEVKAFIDKSLSEEEKTRLSQVASFIEGFESPYGLELLATVDYLAEEHKTLDAQVIKGLLWSDRKKNMFPLEHIDIAIRHLQGFSQQLYPQPSLF